MPDLKENAALWGIVSAFADDETRPLPESRTELIELGEYIGQAVTLLSGVLLRISEEL